MEPAYVCIVFSLDDAGVSQEKLVPSELNRLRAPKSEEVKEDLAEEQLQVWLLPYE